jgi:hypothetical protein
MRHAKSGSCPILAALLIEVAAGTLDGSAVGLSPRPEQVQGHNQGFSAFGQFIINPWRIRRVNRSRDKAIALQALVPLRSNRVCLSQYGVFPWTAPTAQGSRKRAYANQCGTAAASFVRNLVAFALFLHSVRDIPAQRSTVTRKSYSYTRNRRHRRSKGGAR